MTLTSEQTKDIFEWDRTNWSKSVSFWEPFMQPDIKKSVLTLGEKNGGLSLLFALAGHNVIATDIAGVTTKAKALHNKYGVSKLISYENANMLSLPYPEDTFDIVSFKSVLGALRSKEMQLQAIKNIYRVLKPGGTLLFAENLRGTPVHMFLRKRFIPWAQYWGYLDYYEKEQLFAPFGKQLFKAHGFLGTLIPNENLRNQIGHIDTLTGMLIPPQFKYILFGACTK